MPDFRRTRFELSERPGREAQPPAPAFAFPMSARLGLPRCTFDATLGRVHGGHVHDQFELIRPSAYDRRFTVLLGAGFSKWAADLPLASQLFDFAIAPHGPREERRLALVREDWDRWAAEHGGHVEEYMPTASVTRSASVARPGTFHVGSRSRSSPSSSTDGARA